MGTTQARQLYKEDFFAWTRWQANELRRFARSRQEPAARSRAHRRGDRRFGHKPTRCPARAGPAGSSSTSSCYSIRGRTTRAAAGSKRCSTSAARSKVASAPPCDATSAASYPACTIALAAMLKRDSICTATPIRQLASPNAAPTRSIRCSATFGPMPGITMAGKTEPLDHALTPVDGMTADFFHFDRAFLGRVANRIVNEVRGINRRGLRRPLQAPRHHRVGVMTSRPVLMRICPIVAAPVGAGEVELLTVAEECTSQD